MELGDIIREKRKALGLTQEQVATYLGITTPAVNKWEKGLTYPDFSLLPILARLLKTDPNTLLCFKDNLTEHEISLFLNEVALKIKNEDYAQGFALAMDKIKEYPRCAQLQHAIALVLEGALLMAKLTNDEVENYRLQITKLYKRVAESDDADLANRARYMLASQLLQQGEYQRAQELLDQMPKSVLPDKRTLQATLFSKVGKSAEAAALLERMAITSLQETLMTITKLIPVLVAEGKTTQAKHLAKASQTEYEAFGLWQYSAYLAPMQLAVAMRDTEKSLKLIAAMLHTVETPWDVSACPLYCHQPHKESSAYMGQDFLPAMLSDLECNPDYGFLQSDPDFQQLIAAYKAKMK